MERVGCAAMCDMCVTLTGVSGTSCFCHTWGVQKQCCEGTGRRTQLSPSDAETEGPEGS